MGRLERHLDEDLIDRIDAGWTPTSDKKTKTKRKKPIRLNNSYRASRRNAARGTVWRGPETKYIPRPPVRLNRSQRLDGYKPYGPQYVNR